MNEKVLPPEQRADGGYIGSVAAHENHAGFLPVMCGKRRLKFPMQRTLASDQAACRTRGAVLLDGARGCGWHSGMAVQAEVIIKGIII